MNSKMHSCFIPLITMLISGVALSAAAQTPEELVAGIDARIDQVFQAQSGDPYSLVKVKPSLDTGRPYYARGYSWSVMGYAARCFYLNESLSAANARLQQNARYYLRELTPADEAEILPAEAELNTSANSRIVDRDSFHWHADMVLRLIEMYGTHGSVATNRLDAATEAKCLEPIWTYVSLVSRLEKAEYLNSRTWHLWESENHHAQCFSIAWHFSKIAKDLPAYQGRTYANGATPATLYAAWNAYFPEYARERFRKGLFVEMMSKGYNGETIRGLYNFYDFGDPEVKKHAGMLLDLFWAYWAQEQFNDVSGGGKARTYFNNSFTAGHTGIIGNMAWLYFKLGAAPGGVEGSAVNALLGSYRPPAVIADIAVDVEGRGTYEVKQAAQGLGLAGQTGWDQSRDMDPYKLNTDGGGILRYTYCDPAFIMGTPMVDARPLNDWVAISSQNRWQGVIFSGAVQAARIVPCVLPSDEREARNQFWTVQSKGSMITQMLNTQSGGVQMWAWISKDGLTDPVQESGIFFVEAEGAYAAIRPVGTAYTLIEDYSFSSFTAPGHWIVQLTDKYKPLILEVMAKDQVADFTAFKNLVKAHTPSLISGLVTYTTIYGDVLTLDTTYANPPSINGTPVNYAPVKSYDSPFLHGNYNGSTFVIEKGTRSQTYDFSASEITVLNSDSLVLPDTGTPGTVNLEANPAVIAFDAGAGATKLVVTLSSETGSGSPARISYNGEALTQAVASGGRAHGIWYLDHPYTGGVANITIDMTSYATVNGIGVGVLSLTGTAPGVHAIASGTTNSVYVTTTVSNCVIVAGYGQQGSATVSPVTPLLSLYSGDIGSATGCSGYSLCGTPGVQTVSFTSSAMDQPTTVAAAFMALSELTPPPAPSNLTAVAGNGDVALRWSKATGAEGYHVKRATVPGGTYSTVVSTANTNFTDKGAVNGVTYDYVVAATNVAGQSPDSSAVRVTPFCMLPFVEDFEARTTGDLNGQNGWGAMYANVQGNITFGGSALAGTITQGGGYARQSFGDVRTNIWADMRLRVTYSAGTPVPPASDVTVGFYVATNGMVMAFNGTSAVPSGLSVSEGQWVRFTTFTDYKAGRWTLYVNGLRTGPYSLYSAGSTGFKDYWAEGGTTIDALTITPERPGYLATATVILFK